MDAAIIPIGDEILIGQTIDTNSGWLADQLHRIGLRLRQITTIADEPTAILDAVKQSMYSYPLTILTGGLGPTRDDITKHALADFFDSPMRRDEETLARIEGYFRDRGMDTLEMNRGQADVPAAAQVLTNKRGSAPGMWFEKDGRVLISLPGVPYEMKGIMRDEGLKRIADHFGVVPIIHKTVLTQGIAESSLAHTLADWETSLRNEGMFLAYLPSPGRVRLRLTAYPDPGDAPRVAADMERYIDELIRRLPKNVYGRDSQTLAEVCGGLLRAGGLTLATAESCTGGHLAHLITLEPGASDYFKGGITAYANQAKQELVGVHADTLRDHGAVSEATVREMAQGARAALGADYALATTGYAGPEGGTADAPVGTVWIAVASDEGIATERLQLGKHRERNIQIAALTALNALRNALKLRDAGPSHP